jgi:UrcA family protein
MEAFMRKTSLRFISAFSMVALLGVSAAALAAPIRAPEVATRKVRFADLNLSAALDVETLYERIRIAARAVCRHEMLVSEEYACRARAVENAVREVGSPLLVSVHRSATGRTEEVVAR